MIAVLFIWFVIALVCSGIGLLFTKQFVTKSETGLQHDFLITNALVGMSILIPLLAIISLFVRLNGELLATLTAISVGILYSHKVFLARVFSVFRSFRWLTFLGILALPLVLLIYYAVLNPGSIGDTLLYHAQCIQWSEKYKAIPGLAHIHNRLAFNNHSLLPFSLFGFSFTDIQSFYCVNSFLLLLLTLKCSLEMTLSISKKDLKNLVFYAVLLISTYFLVGERIASPAPDNTATVYLIFCVLLFKEIMKDKRVELLPILYLTSFLLPTIKVSTVFVAVLPVLVSFFRKLHFDIRHWAFVIGIGVFTVFPYFARNMILSGYLIFPFPLDLFNFDWQYFDTARLDMMNRYIINAARITGKHDPGLWTYDMSIAEWFPHWLTWRSPQYYFMNFMLPLCLVFNFYALVMRFIKKNLTDLFYICFSIFFFISFLYWLFSAPDYRFIWGTMLSGFSIVAYYVFDKTSISSNILAQIVPGAMILLFGVLAFKSVDFTKAKKHLKLPETIKEIEVMPEQVGPLAIFKPSSKKLGGLCYNAPIPCTHHVHDQFEARGTRLTDGFRMNPDLKKKKKKDKKKKPKPKMKADETKK